VQNNPIRNIDPQGLDCCSSERQDYEFAHLKEQMAQMQVDSAQQALDSAKQAAKDAYAQLRLDDQALNEAENDRDILCALAATICLTIERFGLVGGVGCAAAIYECKESIANYNNAYSTDKLQSEIAFRADTEVQNDQQKLDSANSAFQQAQADSLNALNAYLLCLATL
jgi:hypothetical protein